MDRPAKRGDIVRLVYDTKADREADPELFKVMRKSARTGSLTVRSQEDGRVVNVQPYEVIVEVRR